MDPREHDRGASDSDPDRPSRLGRKALIFGPILVAVGVVLFLLRFPAWVAVGALLLFLIWLLIDG